MYQHLPALCRNMNQWKHCCLLFPC